MLSFLTAPRVRWFVLALWVAIAAAFLPLTGSLEAKLDSGARVQGSQHARAQELLAREFDTPFAESLILVVEGVRPEQAADRAVLGAILERIEQESPQIRTFSYINSGDPLFVGADGAGGVALIGLSGDAAARHELARRVRAAGARAVADLRARTPGLAISWTGEAALNAELREVSARDATAAEMRVLPVVLILLLIAFGSAAAALSPVMIGILTVALAMGVISLVADRFSLSIVTVNVATMLGLGLSIDYALLIVSRFREEAKHASPRDAARIAQKHAGGAILLSGAALAIALAALLVAPVNEIRSIAIGGMIIVVLSMLVSLTALPALLSLIGGRIDALAPLRRVLSPLSQAWWAAWARIVFARPLLFLVLGLAPLAMLALQCVRLDVNLPRGEWLPASAPSLAALDGLDRLGRSGQFKALHVIADTPDGAMRPDAQRALYELGRTISADPRVEAVRMIAAHPAMAFARPAPPEAALRAFLSRDQTRALILVVPREALELREVSQLVRELRRLQPPAPISGFVVGGAAALNADYQDAVADWFLIVALIIVGATYVALAVGYRSLVLPLKAVALNLVSVGAALGALVLVFQDGAGAPWLIDRAYGGVFPNIPILVFSIVFGLSMDYEVFLFNRVAEAHRAGADDREAMTTALRATAGVITSAALIMICVFGAFFLGEFLLIRMLGFALAIAILIDAIVVRLVLGPAIFALAGRWNWWPGRAVSAAGSPRPSDRSRSAASAPASHRAGVRSNFLL